MVTTIRDLPDSLTAPADDDVLVADDVSENETKKVTIADLRASMQAGLEGSGVAYDGTTSGLAATDVQAAIDELAANPGITDHGALDGLGDDDHTQYLLVDGSRAMTGELQVIDGTLASPALQFAGSAGTGIFSPESLAPGVPGVLFSVDGAFGGGFLDEGSGVQFRSNAGSVGVPAVAIDQASTGFHSPGGGALAVGSNGVEVARFQAPSGADPQLLVSGPVKVSDGTVAAPSLGFSADSTCGFYRQSSGTIGVIGSGAERWRISSNITAQVNGAAIVQGVANGGLNIRATLSNPTDDRVGINITNAGAGFTASSGSVRMAQVQSAVSQSGTAGYTILDVVATENSVGSGEKWLIGGKSGAGGTTRVFGVTNEGRVNLGAGSAASPALASLADTTSGLFFVGAGVRWAAAGVERGYFGTSLTWTHNSNFSIETSTANRGVIVTGRINNGSAISVSLTNQLSFNSSSLDQTVARVSGTFAQSGTAGYTALDVAATETSLGSGAKYLINAKAGATASDQRFAVDNAGNVIVAGTVDGRDVAADGAKLDLIAAGTYTPTLTGSDGSILTSLTYGGVWHYIRVGSHVHVTGLVTINTASVASFPYPYVEFTLPIATPSSSIGFLAGVFASDIVAEGAGSSLAGRIQGTVDGTSANGRMVFIGTTTNTDQDYSVSFTYKIT